MYAITLLLLLANPFIISYRNPVLLEGTSHTKKEKINPRFVNKNIELVKYIASVTFIVIPA